MRWSQIFALCTLQNVLGWSRDRFYPKHYLLSDLVLKALAYFRAQFVGTAAYAGGVVRISVAQANALLYKTPLNAHRLDPASIGAAVLQQTPIFIFCISPPLK